VRPDRARQSRLLISSIDQGSGKRRGGDTITLLVCSPALPTAFSADFCRRSPRVTQGAFLGNSDGLKMQEMPDFIGLIGEI